MILGKTIKYRYFPKIRQINALKDIFTEAIGRQISGWINHTYRPGKRTPVLTSGNRKGLNKNELFCNTQFFLYHNTVITFTGSHFVIVDCRMLSTNRRNKRLRKKWRRRSRSPGWASASHVGAARCRRWDSRSWTRTRRRESSAFRCWANRVAPLRSAYSWFLSLVTFVNPF